ncbi:MG2 domain-containing protein [Filimonas zeae]|nr:MG2 domain-containing protein [Filimonas zeae]
MFTKQSTRPLISCICMCMLVLQANAQQKPARRFTLFFEKVYVHTDRDYYTAGEDIWFKAYCTDAQTNLPAPNSANVYAELLSPEGVVVDREVLHLQNGGANGDFKLDEALPAGRYRLRAYTSWMRNFGSMFFFTKDLYVSKGAKDSTAAANSNVQTAATANNNAQAAATSTAAQSDNRILFFPEGGSLIAGVKSRIAFKAESAVGKGIALKGTVLAADGKAVAEIQTTHLGMGSFELQPQPGVVYRFQGRLPDGKPVTADLPQALEQGLAIKITEKDTLLVVDIFTNPATLQAEGPMRVTLGGKHAGKFYLEDTVTLTQPHAVMQVAKSHFPEGVAAFTLYDARLRPQCERLVYIEKEVAQVTLRLKTDKPEYSPAEQAAVYLTATAEDGSAVKAQLSLAVVDAGIIPVATENIITYLQLQSELRGEIEQPLAYFNKDNAQRKQQLDLLLSTQGWRDFLWRRVKDTAIVVRYLPEPGITLSGHVKQVLGGKPLPKMNITLMANEARGNKIYFTESDSSGAWFLDGLPLYGPRQIRLTSRNPSGKGGGMLTMDSVLQASVPVPPLPQYTPLLPDTAALVKQFTTESQKRQTLLRKQQEADTRELEGVVVKNTPKTAVFRDGHYVSFGGPDSTFRITAADFKDYETLENFILHRMPGATSSADTQGVFFMSNGQRIRPRFKVDNVEDLFERIDFYSLPMNVIEQVTIRHMLSAQMTDAWFVYLTLKPEAYQRKQLDLLNVTIAGYYEARDFYVPTPGPNAPRQLPRTTVWWQPNVTTGAGSKPVRYHNPGNKTTIRIVAEGITDKGVPVAGVVNYNIK